MHLNMPPPQFFTVATRNAVTREQRGRGGGCGVACRLTQLQWQSATVLVQCGWEEEAKTPALMLSLSCSTPMTYHSAGMTCHGRKLTVFIFVFLQVVHVSSASSSCSSLSQFYVALLCYGFYTSQEPNDFCKNNPALVH